MKPNSNDRRGGILAGLKESSRLSGTFYLSVELQRN